jgi:hypothetical protein
MLRNCNRCNRIATRLSAQNKSREHLPSFPRGCGAFGQALVSSGAASYQLPRTMAMPCAPRRQAVSRSRGCIPPSAKTGMALPRTRAAKRSQPSAGASGCVGVACTGPSTAKLTPSRVAQASSAASWQEAAHQSSAGLCCRRASCIAVKCTPSAPRRRASSMSALISTRAPQARALAITAPANGSAPTWAGQIQSMLQQNCTGCHTGSNAPLGVDNGGVHAVTRFDDRSPRSLNPHREAPARGERVGGRRPG